MIILIPVLYFVWAFVLFVNEQIMLICSHPFFVGGIRSVCSGLLLVGYTLFVQGKRIDAKKLMTKEWKRFLASSIMLYGLAISGFSLGIKYTTPIVATFIYAVGPFLTAALMYFLYDQKLTNKKMVGLVIGFVSILSIIFAGSGSNESLGSLTGAFIYFASMFLFSYGWIIFKVIISQHKKCPLLLSGLSMVVGGTFALLVSFITNGSNLMVMTLFTEHSLLFMAFIGLTTFSYGLYSYLLRVYSATFLSFAGFLDPVFGTLIGVLLFGYQFHMIFLYAFIALFIGLYIFYKEELKSIQVTKG